jgi:hypothetical protein
LKSVIRDGDGEGVAVTGCEVVAGGEVAAGGSEVRVTVTNVSGLLETHPASRPSDIAQTATATRPGMLQR